MSITGKFHSPEGDIENYFITESWLIDQHLNTELFLWGKNNFGQIGDNTTTNHSTPVTVFSGGVDWNKISCGGNNSSAIKKNGTLWCWGSNSFGQLGDNTTVSKITPITTFSGGTTWSQVSCGYYHTAAIKTDGSLWSWGYNNSGQLGNNTTTNQLTPVSTFIGGGNWKHVSCGHLHTAAIKTDGTLWTWGSNNQGQLGDNTTTDRSTPVLIFGGGTNWKYVSCGYQHTAAIKTDGTLWTWGTNYTGQLGNNTSVSRSTPITTFGGGTNWKQVSCFSHTAAIKMDGTLWLWGFNGSSVIGDNTTIDRLTPVTTFLGGTNWKKVSCGNHTAAIKTDGSLWLWGTNTTGQLADNTIIDRSTPVTTFIGGNNWRDASCGANHTLALKLQYEGR